MCTIISAGWKKKKRLCFFFFLLQMVEVRWSRDCEIVVRSGKESFVCCCVCAVCGHWRQHPGVCLVWLQQRSDRVAWVGPRGGPVPRAALATATHHHEEGNRRWRRRGTHCNRDVEGGEYSTGRTPDTHRLYIYPLTRLLILCSIHPLSCKL